MTHQIAAVYFLQKFAATSPEHVADPSVTGSGDFTCPARVEFLRSFQHHFHTLTPGVTAGACSFFAACRGQQKTGHWSPQTLAAQRIGWLKASSWQIAQFVKMALQVAV